MNPQALTLPDRRVHAFDPVNGREIVRYEKAGKWYLEGPAVQRQPLTVAEAATVASRGDWVVRFDVPGGSAFDRYVRRIQTSRSGV